ncbi:hypothetical protein CSKR_108209 [Clonorchis sinensis]|uniref:Bcl-2 Bcl-2 homology region 1-3 domain-containing protein n=1 Tax=Clonorchis sinensis TaxID=79923 RepID=A0A8T1LWY8_CLOSI|nr:hypothetical protein CSKR_108209 [Clonorchis sinensis]
MPIEGSKTQISRNLGLDLGSYIQGKSFNRSVSISESSHPDLSPSAALAESGASTTFPVSTRRILSGGDAMSEPSPSPLSSATATISPESPPLTSSSIFPVSAASEHESPVESETPPNLFPPHTTAETTSQPMTATPLVPAVNPLSCCSTAVTGQSSTFVMRAKNPYTPAFSTLFQNPVTHRTVSLLSHLIDSRLSPEWRTALFIRTTPSTTAPSPVLHTSDLSVTGSGVLFSPSTAVDSTDSAPLRRVPPLALSPSDEVAVTKRFKHSDDSDLLPTNNLNKTASEPRPPTFSTATAGTSSGQSVDTFVSLRLVTCVCRLADHFESRYRDKLGDLLEDVARLSASHTEAESGADSAIDVMSSTTEGNDTPSNMEDDVSTMLIRSARCRFHQVLNELFRERINWGRVVAMFAFVRALCEHVETEAEVRCHTAVGSGAEDDERDRVTRPLTTAECADVDAVTEMTSSGSQTTATVIPVMENSDSRPISTDPTHKSTTNGSELSPKFTGLRAAHYVAWTAEFIHGSHGIWDWITANGGWDGLIKFESERGIYDSTAGGDRILVGFTEDDAMRLLRRAVTGVATLAVGAVGLVAALRYFSKRM